MYRCDTSFSTSDYRSKRYYQGDKITKSVYNELNYLDQSNFKLIEETEVGNIISDVIDSVIDTFTPSLFSSNDEDSGSSNDSDD